MDNDARLKLQLHHKPATSVVVGSGSKRVCPDGMGMNERYHIEGFSYYKHWKAVDTRPSQMIICEDMYNSLCLNQWFSNRGWAPLGGGIEPLHGGVDDHNILQ